MSDTPQTAPATGSPEPRPPFDVAVIDRLQAAVRDVLLNHPEVAAVAASVVWGGNLNDADITHGVWLGADGPVSTPAGIYGSIQQTMKMLGVQFGRAEQYAEHLQDQARVLGAEAIAKHEELQALQAQIEEARAELGRLRGSA